MNNILEILNNSFGHIDFMNTYNDMIENNYIDTSKLSKEERKEFYLKKNEIKSKLKNEWIKENPNDIIRLTKELVYIYDINSDDKLRPEFEKQNEILFNYLDKQINEIKQKKFFNKRIKQLQ